MWLLLHAHLRPGQAPKPASCPRTPPCPQALAMLATLAGNAAGCGNTVEKFRIVKVENPKFRAAVWDLPGTAQVRRRSDGGGWPGGVLVPLGGCLQHRVSSTELLWRV